MLEMPRTYQNKFKNPPKMNSQSPRPVLVLSSTTRPTCFASVWIQYVLTICYLKQNFSVLITYAHSSARLYLRYCPQSKSPPAPTTLSIIHLIKRWQFGYITAGITWLPLYATYKQSWLSVLLRIRDEDKLCNTTTTKRLVEVR